MEAATGSQAARCGRPPTGACGRPRRKRAAPCRTQRSAKARCLEEDHRQVGEQLLVRGVFHRQHRASTVDAVAHRIGVLAEALSRRVRVTAASHVDPQALDEIGACFSIGGSESIKGSLRRRARAASRFVGQHGRHLGPACPTKQQSGPSFLPPRRIREPRRWPHRPNRCRTPRRAQPRNALQSRR